MRPPREGWRTAICATVLCSILKVNAREIHDLRSASTFEATDKLSDNIEADLDRFEKELIPIKSVTTFKGSRLMEAPLEPDAEMLPAHYTGVKPPGVDHMELKYAESEVLESSPGMSFAKMEDVPRPVKFQEDTGVQHSSSKQSADYQEGEAGRKKLMDFEKGSKGDSENEKKKSEYAEAGGRKKSRVEGDRNVKYTKDVAEGEKGGSYEVEGNREKGHKAAGYHNVYHKDEYKKDADFYDNDHHGGHFKKHGAYDEKHTAAEGRFKKGGSNDSGFQQAQHANEGILEKARARKEEEGHDARQGYDGFFQNFQGFGKQADRADGRKYGYVEGKVR